MDYSDSSKIHEVADSYCSERLDRLSELPDSLIITILSLLPRCFSRNVGCICGPPSLALFLIIMIIPCYTIIYINIKSLLVVLLHIGKDPRFTNSASVSILMTTASSRVILLSPSRGCFWRSRTKWKSSMCGMIIVKSNTARLSVCIHARPLQNCRFLLAI